MTETRKYLGKAKIAGIPVESQISINMGSDGGLQLGDEVVLHKRVEVIDPESGSNLGAVVYPRLNLIINYVSGAFSVAVVKDRYFAPPDPWAKTPAVPLSKLKEVTTEPDEESLGKVLISIGEEVALYRPTEQLLPS